MLGPEKHYTSGRWPWTAIPKQVGWVSPRARLLNLAPTCMCLIGFLAHVWGVFPLGVPLVHSIFCSYRMLQDVTGCYRPKKHSQIWGMQKAPRFLGQVFDRDHSGGMSLAELSSALASWLGSWWTVISGWATFFWCVGPAVGILRYRNMYGHQVWDCIQFLRLFVASQDLRDTSLKFGGETDKCTSWGWLVLLSARHVYPLCLDMETWTLDAVLCTRWCW